MVNAQINTQEFLNEFKEQYVDNEAAELTLDTDFKSFSSWDSLTAISLLAEFKYRYNVELEEDDLNNCDRVADVLHLIEKKIAHA
jgi:acyl carrier protein